MECGPEGPGGEDRGAMPGLASGGTWKAKGRVCAGGQLPPAEPGCRPRKVLAAWALAYRIPLSASVTWSERPAPELAISEKHGQGSPLSVILVPGRVG